MVYFSRILLKIVGSLGNSLCPFPLCVRKDPQKAEGVPRDYEYLSKKCADFETTENVTQETRETKAYHGPNQT